MNRSNMKRSPRVQKFIAKYHDAHGEMVAGLILSIGAFITVAFIHYSSSPQKNAVRFYQIIKLFGGNTSIFELEYYAILPILFNLIVSNNISDLLLYLSIGWLISGIVSGFAFGKLGSSGPRLAMKAGFGFLLELLLVLLVIIGVTTLFYSFDESIKMAIYVGLAALSVVMIVLLPPLSILAFIGNKIGVMIRNV